MTMHTCAGESCVGVAAGDGEGAVTEPVERVERNHRRRKENVLMLSKWSVKYNSPAECECVRV